MDPDIGGEADRLISRQHDLAKLIETLMPRQVDAMRTRLHGDYHLGQVLVSDGDVFIIDFEGEPMRPLAQRRLKQSPLRDVAGMLRSFAYAGAAAQREMPADQQPLAAERLSALIREMSTAFLREYEHRSAGCPSYPADPTHAASLLRIFLLEKALYEVSYEIANRPDWLRIPLSGVLAIIDCDDASDAAVPSSLTRKEPSSSG
jgi:trehalose synthase-fused probable maltokinase